MATKKLFVCLGRTLLHFIFRHCFAGHVLFFTALKVINMADDVDGTRPLLPTSTAKKIVGELPVMVRTLPVIFPEQA